MQLVEVDTDTCGFRWLRFLIHDVIANNGMQWLDTDIGVLWQLDT